MECTFTRIRNCFLLFVITLAALLAGTAAGAQAKFTTVVSEIQPGLNEYIQVEYTVEDAKSVEAISPPSFKNFRLIQGPIQSSGMSMINGALSQYKSISYVLQPLVTGKLNVPGALAVIDGKSVRSNTVLIDVKSKSSGNNNNSSSSTMPFMPRSWPAEEPRVSEEYVLRPGEKMSDKIKNNIFVQADVNKTVCYEGEPVMATFKLCSRLRSESTVLKRPSLNGFGVYDMLEPETNRPSVETIGGKTFNVHTIRKTQLFPLQAGTFTIDPVELSNKVTFVRTGENRTDPRDPMQRFMDRFMEDDRGELEEQSFSLTSKPVSITVKPLPEAGKPAGFNGAVGKFIIYAELEKVAVPAGDPVTIKVQIKGEGNFTVINAPALQLPASFEGYDPVVKETVNKALYPLTGTKTFTYTFTPRDTGTYNIPGTVFSYFDPSRAAYQTIRSDSFVLRVTAPAKKPFFASRNLKINPASFDWRQTISSNILWGVAAALLIILISYLLVRKKQPVAKSTRASSPVAIPVANAVQADVIQEEPLLNARLALAEGRNQEFYGEVNKAVWKKLAATLHIPSTELNKSNVIFQLRVKGVNAEVVSQLEYVLNDCELALYTPVYSASDMQQTLARADSVIKGL